MSEDFKIGDIIEYIDCTRDLNFEAARYWANQNGAELLELIENRKIKEDGLLHRYFQIIQSQKVQVQIVEPATNDGLTEEERIDREKIRIREAMIDRQTIRRSRKIANGTWTDDDEQAYLLLDAHVTGIIEARFGAEYDRSESTDESL